MTIAYLKLSSTKRVKIEFLILQLEIPDGIITVVEIAVFSA